MEKKVLSAFDQVNIEKLRNKLYADSPYYLASKNDNAYRNGVDATLEKYDSELWRITNGLSEIK